MSIVDLAKLFSDYFTVRVFNRDIERWILGYFAVVQFIVGLSLIDDKFIHPAVIAALTTFMPTEAWATLLIIASAASYFLKKWYIAYVLCLSLPMICFGVQLITGFLLSSTHNFPVLGLFGLLVGGGSFIFATKIYPNGKEEK